MGEGTWGQLGNGTSEDSNVPIKIMFNVRKVSLGIDHSAAITEEGDLYTWGCNGEGQLGNGTTEDSNIPIKIMGNVKEVSLGSKHSAAITRVGDLYLWGSNGAGQLGNGTNEDSNVPIKIMGNVKEVILGNSHSAAITEEGDLYLWGSNGAGQLGNGTTGNSNVPIKIMVPSGNSPVSESALSARAESISEENRERITQNWNGTSFIDCILNEIYNYYVLRSNTADQPFASGNLLYIGQAVPDERGILNVAFTMQDVYADADIFAVPMHPIDLSGADVTVSDLTCNGELQYAPVKVSCQGIELAAGEDYYIEGDYGVMEAGNYTLTINGTGLYTGTRTVNYKVLPAITQYQISGTVKSYGNMQDDTVIRLLQGADEVSNTRAVNGMYQLNEIPGGLYTLEVSKANHVTRRYEMMISDMAVGQDAEIWLIGDVNGDGRINAKDKKVIYNHIAGTTLLWD